MLRAERTLMKEPLASPTAPTTTSLIVRGEPSPDGGEHRLDYRFRTILKVKILKFVRSSKFVQKLTLP